MEFKQFLIESENLHVISEARREYDSHVAYLYQRDVPVSSIKSEIASSFGCPISLSEIYRSLRRSGISPQRRERPYRNDVLYFGQNGFGLDEISQLTGYSKRHVRNILKSIAPQPQGGETNVVSD